MKASMWCVALVSVIGLSSARSAEIREQTFFVGADVNTQGQVTVTDVDADAPKPLADLLKRAVSQWRFTPASIQGKAVPAHTFIYAKLKAVTDAKGNYSLRISYDGNGPKLVKGDVLPHYPMLAVKLREQAFVLLDAAVQPDGSLSDLKVSSQFEHWPVHDFESAVLNVGKRWHAIPEQVDGKPVVTRMRIPIVFTLMPTQFTAQQIKILRESVRKKNAADADADPGIPLPSDQPVALDSPLQPSAVATISNAP